MLAAADAALPGRRAPDAFSGGSAMGSNPNIGDCAGECLEMGGLLPPRPGNSCRRAQVVPPAGPQERRRDSRQAVDAQRFRACRRTGPPIAPHCTELPRASVPRGTPCQASRRMPLPCATARSSRKVRATSNLRMMPTRRVRFQPCSARRPSRRPHRQRRGRQAWWRRARDLRRIRRMAAPRVRGRMAPRHAPRGPRARRASSDLPRTTRHRRKPLRHQGGKKPPTAAQVHLWPLS